MCEQCVEPARDHARSTISRRSFVGGAVGLAAASVTARTHAQTTTATQTRPAALTVADGLDILPRDAWGADLPPRAPMAPEDVRFLLIHHTASPNPVIDQRQLIRMAYSFHTGPQKRWPDVAYNFFVGPDGTVWEGRAGSLAGPVVASATGGNQGFAQLVCLLGDYSTTTPPAAMQQSLVRLLALLSRRYDISTWKDAARSFTSRGSDRWPAGQVVNARTISGHRDMTYTACPGDSAYGLLDAWRRETHRLVAADWEREGTQPAQRVALEAP